MQKQDFVSRFGGIIEHSAFLAERAYASGLPARLEAVTVHEALVAAFRAASPPERLGVLRAHPDLAGRLAMAGALTDDSRREQAGAGLDRLSAADHARFTDLNQTYMDRFGFPFIIAVKGLSKDDILAAFERRVTEDPAGEFATACAEVEKIARLRLDALPAEAFA